MKGIKMWFNSLPPNTQVVVILACVLLGYLLVQRAKGFISGIQAANEEKGYIDGLKANGIKASYTKKQYIAYANNLYQAMKGVNWNVSSRNTKVYNIFQKMKNEVDVIELDRAFGIRENADLQTWLHEEKFLDVNLINNHLASKGIDKQF